MEDDAKQLLNELEQACYRGVANLALSKNLQWMLSKKLLRAKAVSLAEKLKSLDVKKADAFFKALEDFSKFPDDKEIVSHLRNNMDKFGIQFQKPVLAFPRHFEDFGKLDELERNYPAFKDFIGLIRIKPDAYMPAETQKVFWSLASNPKTFKSKAV